MVPYQSKYFKLTGSSEREIYKKVRKVFSKIEKKSKRRPYIKSPYFKKQKVFLNYFWPHLNQKSNIKRVDRLRYLECAFELIIKSRNKPLSKVNPNKSKELLHRFAGLTRDKQLFFVQIKEDTKKKKLYFMSVFSTEV